MKFVLIFLGQIVADGLGIITGIFTAGLTDTVRRGSQVGAGTAQILIQIVGQFIKNFFQLRRGRAQKNDITGGTVHVGDAAAPRIPQVDRSCAGIRSCRIYRAGWLTRMV